MAPIGAMFGGPVAGWVADHLGRKAALMLVGVPYLSGYMMIVYAHMIESATAFKVVLLTGRFLTGVGLGWSCLAGPVSYALVLRQIDNMCCYYGHIGGQRSYPLLGGC